MVSLDTWLTTLVAHISRSFMPPAEKKCCTESSHLRTTQYMYSSRSWHRGRK